MSFAQAILLFVGVFLIRLDAHLYWAQFRWESAALYFVGLGLCLIAWRMRA